MTHSHATKYFQRKERNCFIDMNKNMHMKNGELMLYFHILQQNLNCTLLTGNSVTAPYFYLLA